VAFDHRPSFDTVRQQHRQAQDRRNRVVSPMARVPINGCFRHPIDAKPTQDHDDPQNGEHDDDDGHLVYVISP
jgi:hypothetical protein